VLLGEKRHFYLSEIRRLKGAGGRLKEAGGRRRLEIWLARGAVGRRRINFRWLKEAGGWRVSAGGRLLSGGGRRDSDFI